MDIKTGYQIIEVTDKTFYCSQCAQVLPGRMKCQASLGQRHCRECHLFNRRCNYYANKERDIARSSAWNKANPEKALGYVKKHQAKKKALDKIG